MAKVFHMGISLKNYEPQALHDDKQKCNWTHTENGYDILVEHRFRSVCAGTVEPRLATLSPRYYVMIINLTDFRFVPN